MHKNVRSRKITGTGSAGKAAVMGLLERHGPDGHSAVRTKVVPNVRARHSVPPCANTSKKVPRCLRMRCTHTAISVTCTFTK